MSRTVRLAALALALTLVAHADAATVVQTLPFQFIMEPELVPAGAPVPQVTYNGGFYSGSQTLNFNPFNTSLGDLMKVQLDLAMTISGEVHIYTFDLVSNAPAPLAEAYPGLELLFYGDATAGNLVAVADFGDYEVGVDGEPTPYGLQVNESGTGTDSSTSPGDFADFINFDPVVATVYASLGLNYTNIGQIGAARGLTASGDATLTYFYDLDGVIIPTPAALPAGLGLLALSLLRRRAA